MLRTVLLSSALAAAAAAAVHVPLQPGLTIVTALSDRQGDYESIKTIDAVTADSVKVSYSADVPDTAGGKARKVSTRRTVRRDDLRNAHEYMQIFNPAAPETFTGTTAIGASAAVLNELKTKGRTTFTFQTPGRQASADDILAALAGSGAKDAKGLEDLGKKLDASKASGTIERVDPAAPFPVILNGRRTTVPAIHARGTFGDIRADFYFLDDPDNPIALKWTTGAATGALQVVQITWPDAQASPQIEQALKDAGRAEIHGIYFDFGSATIKPESEPVLKEIAGALSKNPPWKLSVEGYTDGIGGDASNLELSRRRAAAVKDALTSRFHVDGGRLTTAGFGAARPKESNETPEGRARNRRVELVRQ